MRPFLIVHDRTFSVSPLKGESKFECILIVVRFYEADLNHENPYHFQIKKVLPEPQISKSQVNVSVMKVMDVTRVITL
jgi:hypothetical protein